MMATSFSHLKCPLGSDRLEGERDDLVAVVVGGERHHGQLDLLAELELRRVVLGEPALDADHVVELHQADAERDEVLTRRARVRRAGREALGGPRDEGAAPRQQHVGHVAGAALGAARWTGKVVAAEQQRRAEYAAAGRQSVVTLMSLDFNKAKEDVQRIIDNSTGQFRDDFKNQADDFIKVAQESKVVTEVTVNATAVESMSDDSAVVLVSASSRVTNSAGAKQEPRSWRLSVNLQRDGGQIKMSKVEFVP